MTPQEYDIYNWLEDKTQYLNVEFICQIGNNWYYRLILKEDENSLIWVVDSYGDRVQRELTDDELKAIDDRLQTIESSLNTYVSTNGYDGNKYCVWRQGTKKFWFLTSMDGRYEYVTAYQNDSLNIVPMSESDMDSMVKYFSRIDGRIHMFLESYPNIENSMMIGFNPIVFKTCPSVYVPYKDRFKKMVLQLGVDERIYWVPYETDKGEYIVLKNDKARKKLINDLQTRMNECDKYLFRFEDDLLGASSKEKEKCTEILKESDLSAFDHRSDVHKFFMVMSKKQMTVSKLMKAIVCHRTRHSCLRKYFLDNLKDYNIWMQSEQEKASMTQKKVEQKAAVVELVKKEELKELRRLINEERHTHKVEKAHQNKRLEIGSIFALKALILSCDKRFFDLFDFSSEISINTLFLCLRQCNLEVSRAMRETIMTMYPDVDMTLFNNMLKAFNRGWRYPYEDKLDDDTFEYPKPYKKALSLPVSKDVLKSIRAGQINSVTVDATDYWEKRLFNKNGSIVYDAVTLRNVNLNYTLTFRIDSIEKNDTQYVIKFAYRLE